MRYLVFLIIFTLYIANLSPTITSDDSGELAGVCHTLGIAHSPGYPLYSITGKIINTSIPFANSCYRTNILSALSTALGIAILYLLFLKISSDVTISFFVSLACGVTPFLYDMATITEVYGLTIFVASLILFVVFCEIEQTKKNALLLFLFGVGVVTHYLIGMWFLAIVYIIFHTSENRQLKFYWKKFFLWSVFFLLGVSPLVFILIRANTEPIYSWEDPKTLQKFLQVVLRTRYGALNLAQGELNLFDITAWFEKLRFLTRSLSDGFTLPGAIIGVLGIFYSFRSKIPNRVFLFLMLLGSGPIFLFLANVRIDRVSSELLLRFFYLLAIVWCLYILIALRSLKHLGKILSIILFILVSTKSINTSNRSHFTFFDYAKNLLRNTPKNSIIFFDRADEMEFCVSYILRVAKKRPDIEFYDCNAGVSKSIYGDQYYKIWGAKRLALRNQVESEIIKTTSKNVLYATFLPTQTTTPKRPFGLLYTSKYLPTYEIDDSIFILRKPLEEIRSKGLYLSHFQLLGEYYLSQNLFDKAERNLSVVFYNSEKNPHPYYKLGYYCYSKGEFEKARKCFEKIIEFFPTEADAFVNLGVISEKEGRLNESREYYLKAIELDNRNENAYYNLGVYYWKKSEWKNAIRSFEKVLELNPERSEVKRFLAIAQQNLLSRPR